VIRNMDVYMYVCGVCMVYVDGWVAMDGVDGCVILLCGVFRVWL
jgi:hypothetical protein